MNRVAVVGAGTMGNGIAQVFAGRDWEVTLIDVSDEALERGMATVRRNLGRMAKKGTITAEDADRIPGRITTSILLEDAAGAELVIEAASERPDLKFGIFEQLDARCPPRTILATNTSSISITEIAARSGRWQAQAGRLPRPWISRRSRGPHRPPAAAAAHRAEARVGNDRAPPAQGPGRCPRTRSCEGTLCGLRHRAQSLRAREVPRALARRTGARS
jgi:hypothetical protein